jgi:predicted Zn-dependent protease
VADQPKNPPKAVPTSLLDQKKAKALCQKALRAAQKAGAESAKAVLDVSREGNLRFANNGATTNGDVERHTLSLEVATGKRHATLWTEDLSEAGVAELADRAVEAVAALPEDAEFVPFVSGPQKYPQNPAAYDAATAEADPKLRAAQAKAAIDRARAAGLVAAGYIRDDVTERTLLGSTGFSGHELRTSCDLEITVRSPDGLSSGWAGGAAVKAADLDAEGLAKRAVEKAKSWVKPVVLEPGKYTVVLEPEAVGELMGMFDWMLDQRGADEGRSPFSKPGGGVRIGEKLFSEKVTLTTDPLDPVQPGDTWGDGGAPAAPLVYVKDGVLQALRVGRYWAQKTGKPFAPGAGNLRLDGGGQSLAQLIEGCERGLLVTRLWYTNLVNPQTISATGLTRDATFLIENGKVTQPVKNFRFNQSVMEMLKNVEALGVPVQTTQGPYAVPALRVGGFEMSSISEAV